MTTAIAIRRQESSIPALSMNEDELIDVLQSSVYPGAKIGSIKLVINVCRASGKDPLKKPYHIVPMSVSTGKKGNDGWDVKEMRDVIMPGINDYRTDASRTGEHVGTSDPEFGPAITETLDGVTITYPEWCKVVVERLCENGIVGKFSAKELWRENYATKSNKSDAPNAMWKKRPYAQLAKCAEAQALRRGFPEVGNQPTADEMEGKELEINPSPEFRPSAKPPIDQPPDFYPADKFDANYPKWSDLITSGKKSADDIIKTAGSKNPLTDEQKAKIRAVKKDKPAASEPGITYAQIAEKLNAAQNTDALDESADLIGQIEDAEQRAELGVIYNTRREELGE